MRGFLYQLIQSANSFTLWRLFSWSETTWIYWTKNLGNQFRFFKWDSPLYETDKFTSIFGSSNDRYLKRLQPKSKPRTRSSPSISNVRRAIDAGQTFELKKRLAAGQTLDDILAKLSLFVAKLVGAGLNMRHYDVQLIGGMVLHSGAIAEMITGEGKTLVATLPAYLNALACKGVHVITVNDYLARRDMEWMGPLYMGLGLMSVQF